MANGVIQNVVNFKSSQIFVTQRITVGRNIVIAHGETSGLTCNITKSGYTPIGIIGWYVDNDPVEEAWRGSAHTFYRLTCDTTTAYVYLRNTHWDTSGNVAVYIDVLYQKVI